LPRGFYAVCGPQAHGSEYDPAEQPGKIERDAEDHRINSVPERDRETHGDEGNQAQEESKARWLLYRHRFTEYSLPKRIWRSIAKHQLENESVNFQLVENPEARFFDG
jgi:hypothetical protein